MEKYILVVDSSERDTNVYTEPNDYTVFLNRPLYNVTKIELVSARIPLSQYIVDAHNNIVIVDSVSYTITPGNYATGTALAAQLKTDLNPSVINNVTYDDDTQKLSFKGTTQFTMEFNIPTSLSEVMGFDHDVTYTSTVGGDLDAPGVINICGPNSILLSITGDSDDYIKKNVYLKTPHEPLNFYGTLLVRSEGCPEFINYDNSADKVRQNFKSSPLKTITKLNVNFLFNNFDSVLPYDFKLRNHILKFEITCSLDKLIVTKENENVKKMIDLPPALKLERFQDPWRPWGDKRVLMYGGGILVFVIVVLIISSSRHVRLRK